MKARIKVGVWGAVWGAGRGKDAWDPARASCVALL